MRMYMYIVFSKFITSSISNSKGYVRLNSLDVIEQIHSGFIYWLTKKLFAPKIEILDFNWNWLNVGSLLDNSLFTKFHFIESYH